MKNLIRYSTLLMILFLMSNCNDDDAQQIIELNERFSAVIGEKYICATDDGDIIIEVTNIEDRRVRGSFCSVVSYAGEGIVSTKVTMNGKEYHQELSYHGCIGIELSPSNFLLPSIEIEGGYILRMLALLPYSVDLEYTDEYPIEYYQTRFIIIK